MRRLIFLVAAAAALPAADLYHVAGEVVDSQTNSSIANATVVLSSIELPRGEMVGRTGADGRFWFNAPQGKYHLSAVVAGRRQSFGMMGPSSDTGTSVITGPDQDTAHLVFRWFRSAVIAGRVLDDQGEPIENANVRLLLSGVAGGRLRVTPFESASTNDRGEYRFWNIPGATYYVVVTANPWYDQLAPAGSRGPQPAASYPPSYYPGTTDIRLAAPLRVQPGEEGHADFTLTAMAAANVTVTCDVAPAVPGSRARSRAATTLSLIAEGIGGTQTIVAQQQVSFFPAVVRGVPPGHYLLRLFHVGPGNGPTAHQWVDVGTGDLTLAIVSRPPASVSGKVTFKGGAKEPGGALVLRLQREPDNMWMSQTVTTDGSFSIPRIEPGRFHVEVYGGGYYAETIRAGDTVLPDGVVNIEDGVETRLSIVASNEGGRLKGFATVDDRPAADMLVVLMPADPASGYPNQGFQTDSDGSFDWPVLRAGDYRLFAVDDPTIAYADPQTVKPYLSQAKQIRIEPGKVLEERVPAQAVAK